MSKTLTLSLGGLGVGGAGVGGLYALKPWESSINTFKEKYPEAILNTAEDSDSWSSKYNSLKSTKPKHPTLIRTYDEATKKTPATADDTKAKRLMREGCQEIYQSKIGNPDNFSDFKNYCSKTNKDSSTISKWNAEEPSTQQNNKWDKSLNLLKDHDPSTKGELPEALQRLKASLTGKTSYEQSNRQELKGWCDSVQLEPFEGKDSSNFKSQELYCKEQA
ncbi:hypothetical protein HF1_04250 [Mycoplasma haemofelis str. Langford 1]|uniref:Uncharacterized protein n=1 Tax=Mycoplasma haemofelis (strain Langford 1) TaxID=941640 RepID=E8ZH12_MYCHL|nr:hypothetical protein [Mycoplasma haemofelis]CBY92433.1 hypothetical protein HF1_04250 [Mycoplasma haemofelis str. Langford 1]